MAKEIFPPVWDAESKQWILKIKNDDGSIQRIRFENENSCNNYISELLKFQNTIRPQRSR